MQATKTTAENLLAHLKLLARKASQAKPFLKTGAATCQKNVFQKVGLQLNF